MSRYARSSPQSYTTSFGPGPITPAVKWILIANIALFVLTQIGILGGDTSVQQGIILAAMALLIYTPLAYMTDRWVYNKNLAKSQQPKT